MGRDVQMPPSDLTELRKEFESLTERPRDPTPPRMLEVEEEYVNPLNDRDGVFITTNDPDVPDLYDQ